MKLSFESQIFGQSCAVVVVVFFHFIVFFHMFMFQCSFHNPFLKA